MSGKKFFQIDPENRPNQTTRERVVSERGRKELPPGTRGGENLKPDRHYEHKQYAFDSYCKKVLKCEACNGYRQISRHQKRFTSLEELSEAEMAQLAVYDRYPWEYTTFPVGRGRDPDRGRRAGRGASGAVPGGPGNLYDALVPADDRRTDRQVHKQAPPDGQYPQA